MIFTYINSWGDSITFKADKDFHITEITGISQNSMTLSEAFTPVQIGSTITGDKVDAKDIEIRGDYRNSVKNRETLLSVVIPGSGRLIMDDGRKMVFVDVEVKESPEIEPLNPLFDGFSFVLRVPYPYWKSYTPISAGFVTEEAKFKFPQTFHSSEGFYVSTRTVTQIRDILNNSPMPVGFIAEFTASGIVKNPEFTKIDTQEKMQFKGIELQDGDILRISTEDTGKFVRLIRAGKETNVFNLLTDDSRFFKLDRGRNTLQYDCELGLNFLTFDVIYYRQYVGV